MRKGWIAAGAAVLLLGGGFAVYRYNAAALAAAEAAKESVPVADPVKAENKVVADGHLEPVRHAALTFPGGGLVAEVLVQEGSQVKAGQVIARLEAASQRAGLAQAQAALVKAQARVQEMKAGARPEELAAARAAVDAAQARLNQVKQGAEQEAVDSAALEVNLAQERLTAALRTGQQAQIAVAEAELTAAENQLVNLTRGASEEEVAAAEAEVRRAQAQLELVQAGQTPESLAIAQADVTAAMHEVERAEAALSQTELVAPFDGSVAMLEMEVGEVVSPGTPVARLADLSGWKVVTDDLSELSVAAVREGSPATITFDAIPDLELPGKVSHIGVWGQMKQGDMTYQVIVTPDTLDDRFRWNMTATVSIEGR